MKSIINLYKPLGWTPLEALNAFKGKNPEYKDIKMSYAGRLDPMAEGIVLVLVGDRVKEQEKLKNLDKEYEAEVLLGFESDTYDILGLPKFNDRSNLSFHQCLSDRLRGLVGDFTFRPPLYSSIRVQGKPLYWWARQGKIVKAPERTTKIYSLDNISERTESGQELLKDIINRLDLVRGDFRQAEIKKTWQEVLGGQTGYHPLAPSLVRRGNNQQFKLLKFRIHCQSGTYIRSLAQRLGGVLFSLKRTKVGEYDVKDAFFCLRAKQKVDRLFF